MASFTIFTVHTLYVRFLILCCLSLVGVGYAASHPTIEGKARDIDTGLEISYHVDQAGYAVHDDIILGKHDEIQQRGGAVSFKVTSPSKNSRRQKRAAPTWQAYVYWPNNTVFYSLKNASPSAQRVFLNAVDIMHRDTFVKFVDIERSPQPGTFLDVTSVSGNVACATSYIGKTHQGAQRLTIRNDCEIEHYVLHELMHALGFYHEHERPDRDEFISLPKEYPKEDIKKHYPIKEVAKYDSPYDYYSIMHYPGFVMKKVPGQPRTTQQEQLSQGDKRAINALYPQQLFIDPRQIALAVNEREVVRVTAPCNATITFLSPPQVKVSRITCENEQHTFEVTAQQIINIKNSDIIFYVQPFETGAEAKQIALSVAPKAQVISNINTLVGTDDTLTISIAAACEAVMKPYLPPPGLKISYVGCQNSRHAFNVSAEPNALATKKILNFHVSYGGVHQEIVSSPIEVRPAIVRDSAPDTQVRSKAKDTLSSGASTLSWHFTSTSRCMAASLNLPQGTTARIKIGPQRGRITFSAFTGSFNYRNDSLSTTTDSFTVALTPGNGSADQEVRVILHTQVNKMDETLCWKQGQRAQGQRASAIPAPKKRSLPENQLPKRLATSTEPSSCVEALRDNAYSERVWGTTQIGSVVMSSCVSPSDKARQWLYDSNTGLISNLGYPNYCLAKAKEHGVGRKVDIDNSGPVIIAPCDQTERRQRWFWNSQDKTISLVGHDKLFLTRVNRDNLMVISQPDFKIYRITEDARYWTWKE